MLLQLLDDKTEIGEVCAFNLATKDRRKQKTVAKANLVCTGILPQKVLLFLGVSPPGERLSESEFGGPI